MISKLGRAVLMVEIGVTDAKTTFKRPSGAPKTSQRWPQNPPKAIFGSKRRANQGHESSKMNLEALFGGSRGPSDLPRAFQELRKRAKDGPRTLPRPSSAASSEQTRPKRVPRRIWRPSLVDLEAPRSSQETPKSSQKEPKRAPTRFQNHLWIEDVVFSKMLRFHDGNQSF